MISNLTLQTMEGATRWNEEIWNLVDELEFPATMRSKVAGACFVIAIDIHEAVALLCRNDNFGPAFSLLRPSWEAYVRGCWLSHCATSEDVERFAKGKEPPRIDTLIQQIEAEPIFEGGVISSVKAKNWRVLNAFTHIGGEMIQRYLKEEVVQRNFDEEEIREALGVCGATAGLAAMGMAVLADDVQLAYSILERWRSVYDEGGVLRSLD